MKLKAYAKKHGIRFVVLYGSHAKGTARKQSDYDVAVLFNRPEKFHEQYRELLSVISAAQNVPMERLDLANLGTDNILFRYEITRGGKLLYGDAADFAQYQGFAFREYMDASSLFALEQNLVERRQEHFRRTLAAV